MFNISRSNNSLLITSNDNSQFPWKDGKMSIPMNSVTYVIDESDYIAFRSISNNDILFTALIDEIQIEGESVTKDTIIEKFDAVANGSTGGGSASVDLSNYYTKEETDALVNAVEEADPRFESWRTRNNIVLGNRASIKSTISGAVAIGLAANSSTAYGLAIGSGADGFPVTADNTYPTNINNQIVIDGNWIAYLATINGDYNQISVEWNGTQEEYDALGTYDSNVTYNIIEG